MDRAKRSNGTCRCQQLSTVDSDKTQTQWYKEMYGQIHKSPERKKDVILVKIPPTLSRYREEQLNPYKPTYTFPEEFDGDLERMENYIRKAASETLDDEKEHVNSKRTDQFSSASMERTKPNNNNNASSSSITINPTRTTDDEQKLTYKKILRGGDIPSTGLQKLSVNNRGRHMVGFYLCE
jgi:hypothetical protein